MSSPVAVFGDGKSRNGRVMVGLSAQAKSKLPLKPPTLPTSTSSTVAVPFGAIGAQTVTGVVVTLTISSGTVTVCSVVLPFVVQPLTVFVTTTEYAPGP